MQSSKQLINFSRILSRQMCVSCKPEVPSGIRKIKALQAKYQTNDGIPVFLKGGFKDKILYQTTMVLTVFGIGWSCKLIYDLSFPKKIYAEE